MKIKKLITDAKRAANKENAKGSTGPKSKEGKSNSSRNALKDGLSSKRLVIEMIGERKEDFNRMKEGVWGYFQPENIVQEMLAADLVENRWRMRRVREAERAEIMRNIRETQARAETQTQGVSALQTQFLSLFSRQLVVVMSASNNGDAEQIAIELDRIQSRLESTSSGITFLIESVEEIGEILNQTKTISDTSELFLTACAGRLDKEAARCRTIMATLKKKAATERKTQGALGPAITGREEAKKVEADDMSLSLLQSALLLITLRWREMRDVLDVKERIERKMGLLSAALLSAESLNRISRAEASAERGFQKALLLLLALKNEGGIPRGLLS